MIGVFFAGFILGFAATFAAAASLLPVRKSAKRYHLTNPIGIN